VNIPNPIFIPLTLFLTLRQSESGSEDESESESRANISILTFLQTHADNSICYIYEPLFCYHFNFTVMFDFEKLTVYRKSKIFNAGIRAFIKTTRLDNTTNDQLRRAAFSVVLNLAEGSGRFSKPDRRNFYVISRSSIFECIAILDVLRDEGMLEEFVFKAFYDQGEELSKILFAMITNLQKANNPQKKE
jgi:four helix bundle protein